MQSSEVERPEDKQADESIGALLGQVVDDAEAFIKAEVELYRAEAFHRMAGYRKYLIFAAVGGLLSLCAVILLLIGVVFLLAPFITIAGAAFLVAALALAVAGILCAAIYEKVRRDFDGDDEDEA